MSSKGFKLTIPAIKRFQTHALDRMATKIGMRTVKTLKNTADSKTTNENMFHTKQCAFSNNAFTV
jgi:hypothetical protein